MSHTPQKDPQATPDQSSDAGSKMSGKPKKPISKRQVRRFLIRPKNQVRWILFLSATGLTVTLLLIMMNFYMMMEVTETLLRSGIFDQEATVYARSSINYAATTNAIYLGLLLLFSVGLGVVLSHRVFGPVVALNRHIDALMRGELTHRVHLRKTDELSEVAEKLNTLAAHLEKESQSRK